MDEIWAVKTNGGIYEYVGHCQVSQGGVLRLETEQGVQLWSPTVWEWAKCENKQEETP